MSGALPALCLYAALASCLLKANLDWLHRYCEDAPLGLTSNQSAESGCDGGGTEEAAFLTTSQTAGCHADPPSDSPSHYEAGAAWPRHEGLLSGLAFVVVGQLLTLG